MSEIRKIALVEMGGSHDECRRVIVPGAVTGEGVAGLGDGQFQPGHQGGALLARQPIESQQLIRVDVEPPGDAVGPFSLLEYVSGWPPGRGGGHNDCRGGRGPRGGGGP